MKIYFDEIKEAYAFGLSRSSITLCRALLEMALLDKLKRKGYFKNKKNKIKSIDVAKQDNLYSYINMAKSCRILISNYAKKAHQIRISANEILHLKDDDRNFDRKGTLEIIFGTVEILEHLYK
jgi:hypothetical protein